MRPPRRAVAGIRIKRNSPVRFVYAEEVHILAGDRVEVELPDEASTVEAEVAVAPDQLLEGSAVTPAGRVVRLVSHSDLDAV